MTNTSDMNIDFLLGLGSSPDGPSPAGPSGAENSGPLFAEMLNDMLMSYPGAATRQVVDSEASEVAQFAKQFELFGKGQAHDTDESVNLDESKVPVDKGVPPVVPPTRFPEMQPSSTVIAQPKRMMPEGVSGLTSALQHTPASTDKPIVSSVPIADGVQTVVEENISAFNNAIRAQLPTHALPMMNTAIRMNLAVPTSLEAGSYEVIESRQADGAVTLKLADPLTRDGFIQVKLPIERLSSAVLGSKDGYSEQPVSVKRVDLDAVPKQTTNVERLFAQLNLKQIEVSNVAVGNDSASDHVAIKLTGTKNDGVDVQLKAQLPQDQLNALKVEPQLSQEVKTDGLKQPETVPSRTTNYTSMQKPDAVQTVMTKSYGLDDQFPASRRESAPEPKPAADQEATKTTQPHRTRVAVAQLLAPIPAPKIRNAGHLRSSWVVASGSTRPSVTSTPQATVPVDSDQLLTAFGQSLKQSLSTTSKIVNNVVKQTTSNFDLSTFGGDSEQLDPFANLESARETGKTLTGKLSQREIRFSLPDDLASRLKPNGQSVMIRIQPDHLGPARLSLRMHQDKLSARITVETVGIKAVVEQSLDRLIQQLTKSGIDVERIEVALDGRQSGEHLSERHPHWQRQARPAHFDENILTETNEVSPIATATPAYVGAGGVNVLA